MFVWYTPLTSPPSFPTLTPCMRHPPYPLHPCPWHLFSNIISNLFLYCSFLLFISSFPVEYKLLGQRSLFVPGSQGSAVAQKALSSQFLMKGTNKSISILRKKSCSASCLISKTGILFYFLGRFMLGMVLKGKFEASELGEIQICAQSVHQHMCP